MFNSNLIAQYIHPVLRSSPQLDQNQLKWNLVKQLDQSRPFEQPQKINYPYLGNCSFNNLSSQQYQNLSVQTNPMKNLLIQQNLTLKKEPVLNIGQIQTALQLQSMVFSKSGDSRSMITENLNLLGGLLPKQIQNLQSIIQQLTHQTSSSQTDSAPQTTLPTSTTHFLFNISQQSTKNFVRQTEGTKSDSTSKEAENVKEKTTDKRKAVQTLEEFEPSVSKIRNSPQKKKFIKRPSPITQKKFSPEDLKETARRKNLLQEIREKQEFEEKSIAQKETESSISNYLRVLSHPQIRIGNDFQANIPIINKKPARKLRCAWDPSVTEPSQVESFLDDLGKIIGDTNFSHERSLKHYLAYDQDNEKSLASIKKNKTYYKNLFCKGPIILSKELKKLIQ